MLWLHTKTLVICDRYIKIIPLTKDLDPIPPPCLQKLNMSCQLKSKNRHKIYNFACCKDKIPQILTILLIPDYPPFRQGKFSDYILVKIASANRKSMNASGKTELSRLCAIAWILTGESVQVLFC